ncbi:histidine phosphatase family protein [Tabrizicola oligotrophica]|uniref:histidine phosphatase family protein n=1 Tax=Tabrizicola oligotrophica TaxID=2710650 RepID=UPI003899C2F2
MRHGPTHAKAMVGWTDLPADLSDHAALARLNAHLPDVPVISSDLSRAVATADRLQARPRLPHDRDWRELHFGAWEMRSFAEVEAESPDHIRAFWETPGDVSPPGGESWNAVTARVETALRRLAHLPEVIVVAHFGAIVAAIQHAGAMTPTEAFSHKIDNLSVTCLEFGAAPRVISVNHIP